MSVCLSLMQPVIVLYLSVCLSHRCSCYCYTSVCLSVSQMWLLLLYLCLFVCLTDAAVTVLCLRGCTPVSTHEGVQGVAMSGQPGTSHVDRGEHTSELD